MARRPKALPIFIEPEQQKRSIPSQEEVLGRNLAAAFIATQHGIGLDYARKKYADRRAWSWTTWRSILRCHRALLPRSSDAGLAGILTNGDYPTSQPPAARQGAPVRERRPNLCAFVVPLSSGALQRIALWPAHGAKYPLMSMITSLGSLVKTHTEPFVPAGTMAPLATTRPGTTVPAEKSFSVETTG
jgi:hypothetical protein